MWLFDLFFPQFYKSDMPKYGYLEVLQSPLDYEIKRVDCIDHSHSLHEEDEQTIHARQYTSLSTKRRKATALSLSSPTQCRHDPLNTSIRKRTGQNITQLRRSSHKVTHIDSLSEFGHDARRLHITFHMGIIIDVQSNEKWSVTGHHARTQTI